MDDLEPIVLLVVMVTAIDLVPEWTGVVFV
jgi:hypothetical protein